jgi:aspartate/methionine/tyrosine aminotransferase
MRHVDRITAILDRSIPSPQSWLVGEPCFDPPDELVEASAHAARSRSYRYPPHHGLQALREVLAARHSKPGQMVTPEQVAVTNGAKGGLLALFATILEPGDELIHPEPCYPAYPNTAARFGAHPVGVAESSRGFQGWADAVASRIGPRTRAVVLASPSNPTGTTLSAAEAEALVELCRDRGLRLVCDEAYIDFRSDTEDGALVSDFDPERTTVVQIRSASKSWALCGWRVGWLVADAPLVSRVAATHAALINPAPGSAQTALCALPEVSSGYLSAAREKVARRMAEVCGALQSFGIPFHDPEGGFYLWLNVGSLISSMDANGAVDWCEAVARRHRIGFWPGNDFGGPDHVRMAVTSPSDSEWQPSVERLALVFGS